MFIVKVRFYVLLWCLRASHVIHMTEDCGSYIQAEKFVGIYALEKEAESILTGEKGIIRGEY